MLSDLLRLPGRPGTVRCAPSTSTSSLGRTESTAFIFSPSDSLFPQCKADERFYFSFTWDREEFWQAFKKHLKNSFRNITFEQYLNGTDGLLMQNDGEGSAALGRVLNVDFKEPNMPPRTRGQQQFPTSPEWPRKGMGFYWIIYIFPQTTSMGGRMTAIRTVVHDHPKLPDYPFPRQS